MEIMKDYENIGDIFSPYQYHTQPYWTKGTPPPHRTEHLAFSSVVAIRILYSGVGGKFKSAGEGGG